MLHNGSLGRALDLLGGDLPGEGGKCRRESQQPLRKRKQIPPAVLNQAAHAAVRKKGSYFQAVFRRLLPRLGYKSALWAIAHRLCRVVWKVLHEGVRFIEHGRESDPTVRRRRARLLARALRKLGYDVAISPMKPPTADSATPTQ